MLNICEQNSVVVWTISMCRHVQTFVLFNTWLERYFVFPLKRNRFEWIIQAVAREWNANQLLNWGESGVATGLSLGKNYFSSNVNVCVFGRVVGVFSSTQSRARGTLGQIVMHVLHSSLVCIVRPKKVWAKLALKINEANLADCVAARVGLFVQNRVVSLYSLARP